MPRCPNCGASELAAAPAPPAAGAHLEGGSGAAGSSATTTRGGSGPLSARRTKWVGPVVRRRRGSLAPGRSAAVHRAPPAAPAPARLRRRCVLGAPTRGPRGGARGAAGRPRSARAGRDAGPARRPVPVHEGEVERLDRDVELARQARHALAELHPDPDAERALGGHDRRVGLLAQELQGRRADVEDPEVAQDREQLVALRAPEARGAPGARSRGRSGARAPRAGRPPAPWTASRRGRPRRGRRPRARRVLRPARAAGRPVDLGDLPRRPRHARGGDGRPRLLGLERREVGDQEGQPQGLLAVAGPGDLGVEAGRVGGELVEPARRRRPARRPGRRRRRRRAAPGRARARSRRRRRGPTGGP